MQTGNIALKLDLKKIIICTIWLQNRNSNTFLRSFRPSSCVSYFLASLGRFHRLENDSRGMHDSYIRSILPLFHWRNCFSFTLDFQKFCDKVTFVDSYIRPFWVNMHSSCFPQVLQFSPHSKSIQVRSVHSCSSRLTIHLAYEIQCTIVLYNDKNKNYFFILEWTY